MKSRPKSAASAIVATSLVVLAMVSPAEAQSSSPAPSSIEPAAINPTREIERASITASSVGAPFDVRFEPTDTTLDRSSLDLSVCSAPCMRRVPAGRYRMTVTSRESLRMAEPIVVGPGERLYLWIRPPSSPTGGIALSVIGGVFLAGTVPLAIAAASLGANTGFLSEWSHQIALDFGLGAAASGILGTVLLVVGIGNVQNAQGGIEHRGATPHPHLDLSFGLTPGGASGRFTLEF